MFLRSTFTRLISRWRLLRTRTFLCYVRSNTGERRRCCHVSASLVPNYPRIGEPIRDWIANSVPQLPGFNGEDLTRIFLQDLQTDPVGALTRYTLGGALLVAFVYWEGGIILHEIERRRNGQQQQQGQGQEGGGPPAVPPRPNEPSTPQQEALYERKRGLAWLAIITALFIWCTGIVNRPAPFMP